MAANKAGDVRVGEIRREGGRCAGESRGDLGGAGGMSDIWLRAGRCWHAVDVSRILHHRAPHAVINDANALSHLNPSIWPALQGGFVKLRGQQVVSRSPEMFQ